MILTILIILGLTVAAAPVASALLGRDAGWILGLPLIGAAVLAAGGYQRVIAGQPVVESVAWLPTIDVALDLRLDGLSLVFLLLVLIIGAGVLWYSTRYLHHKDTAFYLYICGFAAAMALLVSTDNLMVFYIAWELTTLCSFFLISNSGAKGHDPAIRTLLVTVLGGLFLLTATVIIAISTGTMSLSAAIADPLWQQNHRLATVVAILVALAAFTKSAQFPFQAWLPDSMVAIAPVSAYLHAAAMVKAGIYLILRYSPMFAGINAWHVLLVVAGGFTAIFGAMTAVRRDDLKELLAYSTMSQLGLLVFAVGIGTDAAIAAAIVHTIAHACFKAALFMTVGIIEHETGTRSYAELRRTRIVAMPITKTIIVIAGLSMAGIPPLLGFISKEGLITAAVETGFMGQLDSLLTAVIVITSVFTFAYSLRYIIGAWGQTAATRDEEIHNARQEGREPAKTRTIAEARPTVWLVPALLALVTVVAGLQPHLLDDIASAAALAALGSPYHVHLALWHGVNIPLALTAVIIGMGLVFVRFNRELDRAMGNFGAPIKGLDVVEKLRAGIISMGARYFTAATGTTSMRRHLTLPLLALVGIAVVGMFVLTDLPAPRYETTHAMDWVFTAIVGIGVLAVVTAKSRLTVVVVASITGFGVTLWFYGLGAADVATTQLTVEILTVCVLVLILHRLPDHFTPETRRSHFWSIVLALAVGTAAFLAVWGLTGRRDKSQVAEFFLEHAYGDTGGTNIVNTILVDYRAFDTFGELTVLGMAGISMAVLLRVVPLSPIRSTRLDKDSPILSAEDNAIFLRTTTKIIGPIIIALSILLFVRGHYETGGGFVAALVGSGGVALLYLSPARAELARVKWPYFTLIGSGVTIAALTGLFGYLEGSFLTSLHVDIAGTHQTSAMIFDLGVYLAVVGVVVLSFNLVGMPQPGDKPEEPATDRQPPAQPTPTALTSKGPHQ